MTNFYNLDLDTIKDEIKTYLEENTSLLKDYNYEGSLISELNGLLAFVSQYQNFYLNMISNELFLSTAKIPANIYKLANALNYVPKRKSSPYVDIDVKSISIPYVLSREQSFSTFNGFTLYYMGEDVTLTNSATTSIRLHQGTLFTESIDYSSGYRSGVYIRKILNDNNDIDNDYFYIIDDDGNEWDDANRNAITVYNQAEDGTGKFYFIDYSTGTFNVIFDDGKMFESVVDNNRTMTFKYILSSGTLNNGTDAGTVSTLNQSINILTDSSVILNGGSDEDSIAAIKLKAPLFYNTNYRAVTAKDHNTLIKNYSAYNSYDGIVIWGGDVELVDENRYLSESSNNGDKGYIYYTALKDNLGYPTTVDKDSIETYIDNYRMISLLYRYVSPIVHHINATINIKWNLSATDTSTTTITDYITNNFVGFNKTFRKSELINFIDDIDGVDYAYVDCSSCITSNGFIDAVPSYIIRLFNNIDSSVTINGFVGSATISNVGNNFMVGGVNSGTISLDTEFAKTAIYVKPNSLMGSFTFSFALENYEYVQSKKETYLNFNITTVTL